ncbi:HET-domain-containing protein [Lophiostoma macrostomum CBS 122681]|uniref:HET-domain-containing protein n=1 Tax=Lophiostoma macrostomum CBS 122681 TaxID=1314788 RepID=A0A6A6SNB0_9PLEO|nr:HET-domain-containing protein [Lophiostoma macrostomum CBS 122681]
MIGTMLRSRFASVFQRLIPVTFFLNDAEEKHGPCSPQLLSALQKLGDVSKENGDSASLERIVQRLLIFEEKTAGRIHSDTIATSFKLTDLYIQRRKMKEALSLLERIAERSRKLGSDRDVKTHALYQTEMVFERRTLYQLGVDFRNRNFYDESVNVLESAFESYSKAFGDAHTATAAIGRVLSFSYLQQFYQQPLRNDRPRHQCVVKLAHICERILKIERNPIWVLGLMCLRSNDAANASFAFKQPINSGTCDVCQKQIRPRTRWLACKSCLFVFICDDCYQEWTKRTEPGKPITPTCAGHVFHIIGVEDSDQASTRGIDDEEEVRSWLRGLVDPKTKLATTLAFLEYWERLGKPEELRDFRNPVYFYESDSLPAHVDEVQAKAAPVQRLKWHQSTSTVSVPLLLDLFFTPKGFSKLELPQWKLDETASEDDLLPELIERAQAILGLAGIPDVQSTELDLLRPDAELHAADIYQEYPIAEPGNSIRLLTLLPGEGSLLKATLSCANLSSSPTYEALSYVWGAMETEASYSIELESTEMEITPNLYHALQSLRLKEEPRVLWVDSLCINQKDNKDKEVQICMMLEIYKSAGHVLVYLGEPSPGGVALFSFLNRDTHEEPSVDTAIKDLGLEEKDIQELLEAYVQFCLLPWWSRIWVQQEYSLARSNPTFYLGRHSVEVSALLRDWKILQRNVATHLIPFAGDFKLDLDVKLDKSWQPIMRQILHVYGVLTLRSAQNRPEFPYLWLPRGVLKKVNLKCTNPRDRIYGMLSFLDPIAQAVFTPNYSESIESAFRKFAIWVLVLDGWQQVFWWYPYKFSSSMPSWVPDFTRPIPEAAMLEHNLFDYGKLRKSASCPLAIRDGILAMEGYFLDTVEHVYAIDQPDWPNTVRELWFLENIFAATPTAALLRKAPPVFKSLPGLHTRDLIRKWISPIVKRNMESMVFELPPFNIFEKHDILRSSYDPFFNAVKNAYRAQGSACESLVVQLQSLPKDFEPATLQARIPISLQIYEHLNLASALMKICTRLSTLRLFLQKANHTSTDLFGAALFDYPNLISQIEHLRKPSLPSQFSEAQNSTIATALHNLEIPTNDTTSPDWIPRNDSATSLSTQFQPSYELLQYHITACEHEAEVRLRVCLVQSYIATIRAFPFSQSTQTNPTTTTTTASSSSSSASSYIPYRDQQIADKDTIAATFAADHEHHTKLSQLILSESSSYFAALAAHTSTSTSSSTTITSSSDPSTSTSSPPNPDPTIPTLLTEYATVLSTNETTSRALSTTIARSTAQLHAAKPQILANKMYQHGATAFDRESEEHAAWLSNRTFFSTGCGLVGVGCQGVRDVKVGDRIVVLKNTEFPLVIRPVRVEDRARDGDGDGGGDRDRDRDNVKEDESGTGTGNGDTDASKSEDTAKNTDYYTIVGYAIVRGFKYEEFEKLDKFEKPLRQAFYFR